MSAHSGLRRPFLAGVLACLALTATAADPPIIFVTLGTSESLYYDVGRALCSVVDKTRREHGIRCSPEQTPGSVYNLERLADRDLDLALAQSDAQFAAYRGERTWEERPFTELRSVMSLYPELLTILTRVDLGLGSLQELRGKRINVGSPGSGNRTTWDKLQAALGWGAEDMQNATEMTPDRAGTALCAGKIDASVLMVGHPSPIVTEELAACALGFIGIGSDEVDQLVSAFPYYTKGAIPTGQYGLPQAVPTFGGVATLVTTAAMPEPVVYEITRQILAHLDDLRTRLPVLHDLKPETMARQGLTAPLHPGAERAFREFGVTP